MTDNRIPIEEAIDQVAAKLNMPRAQVEEYARQLKAMHNAHTEVSVITRNMRTALTLAAEAQSERMKQLFSRPPIKVEYGGVDITRMLSSVRFASERIGSLNRAGIDVLRLPAGSIRKPIHPADRRTIRLAGRPKHFIDLNGRLTLVDGESPWT